MFGRSRAQGIRPNQLGLPGSSGMKCQYSRRHGAESIKKSFRDKSYGSKSSGVRHGIVSKTLRRVRNAIQEQPAERSDAGPKPATRSTREAARIFDGLPGSRLCRPAGIDELRQYGFPRL